MAKTLEASQFTSLKQCIDESNENHFSAKQTNKTINSSCVYHSGSFYLKKNIVQAHATNGMY
ncbi:MAG: hypothetical protein ACI910_002939 [Oleispira sp.]|jgi:hypothetical protein